MVQGTGLFVSEASGQCGVMYVATGKRFLREAAESRRSWEKWMPGYPVVVFTDEEKIARDLGFERVVVLDEVCHSFADKVGVLERSPFERTIFLDTDTRICGPLDELFQILDRWEVAAVAAPLRETWPQPDLPRAFPEVNSGVLVWRKGTETDRLWAEWGRLYAEHVARTGQTDDQPSLRRALYETGVRLWSLPPEYNFRTVLPGFAGRGAVKILHGRHRDFAAIEQEINGYQGCRLVVPGDRDLRPGRLMVLGGAGRKWIRLISGWFGLKEALRDTATKGWRALRNLNGAQQ